MDMARGDTMDKKKMAGADIADEESAAPREDDAKHQKAPGKKKVKEQGEDLEETLEILKKEKEELYDHLLREKAEFDNYRKRSEREKREMGDYVRGEVISQILEIHDNFERAIEHMDSEKMDCFCEGVELIYKQFSELLDRMGVKPVDGVGTPFDPRVHEALSQEETTEMPDGAVLRVFQKGYLYKDKLLRPAKVVVAANKGEQA